MLKPVVLLCLLSSKLFGFNVVDANRYAKAWDKLSHNPQQLQKFLQAMPKGADLHLHASGAIPTEDLIEMAAKYHYCIQADFRLIPKDASCVDFADFILDPKRRAQIINAWSMDDSHRLDAKSRAKHFFATFPKFDLMVKAHWPEVIAKVIAQAEAEQILYLEIMVSMQGNKPRANGQDFSQRKDVRAFIEQNIVAFRQLKSQVLQLIPKPKTDYALILEIKRNQDFAQFKLDAWEVFAIANAIPDVVGINLVQPEYAEFAQRDYKKQLKYLKWLTTRFMHRPLVLHAGEIPFDLASTQEGHVALALTEVDPLRIGHGVSILCEKNHDQTLRHMRNANIAVEINLTSNAQILDIKGKDHPITAYLARKVPVVLSSDDPGVSRNHLSQEYYRAITEHHLSLKDILQINRNSLTYSLQPGSSLWLLHSPSQRVKACRLLNSKSCLNYIRSQPKATLQWHLEQELARYFEHHLDGL